MVYPTAFSAGHPENIIAAVVVYRRRSVTAYSAGPAWEKIAQLCGNGCAPVQRGADRAKCGTVETARLLVDRCACSLI
jgi:hypothetical protein